MQDSISLLILAAGLGSRFGADKQIFELSSLHLPILAFSLQDAVKNKIDHAVIVTRSNLGDFFQNNIFPLFPSLSFDIVFQDKFMPQLPKNRTKPWGTGHATLCAKGHIHGNFIVINADDFYGPNALARVTAFLTHSGSNQFCCVGYPIANTLSPNGPVSRGIIQSDSQNFITSIVEVKQVQRQFNGSIVALNQTENHSSNFPSLLQPEQPVSMNLFGLNSSIFPIFEQKFKSFLKKNKNSLTAEFDLPMILTDHNILTQIITIKMLLTQDFWFGITYKKDLPFVENQLTKLINQGIYSR